MISAVGEVATINLGLGGGYTINHSKATSNMSGVDELVEGDNFVLNTSNRLFDV